MRTKPFNRNGIEKMVTVVQDVLDGKHGYGFIVLVLIVYLGAGGCQTAEPEINQGKTIHLFNGNGLSNFYTFIRGRGRDNDPKKVFTVNLKTRDIQQISL